MKKSLFGILLLISIAATVPAFASITFYDNREEFNDASSGLTGIDFEGLARAGLLVDFCHGVAFRGATFTGSSNYLFVVHPGFAPDFYDWGSGAVLLGPQLGTIAIKLPTDTYAVGSDIMSILNYASPINIIAVAGGIFTFSPVSLSYPYRQFAGFISTEQITSISFTAADGYPELDNFTFGRALAAPVPEPATIFLLGAGLAVAGMCGRKFRKLRV